MTGIDRDALIDAAAKSMALDWKELLREATAAVDAVLPLLADAIEARPPEQHPFPSCHRSTVHAARLVRSFLDGDPCRD